MIFDELVASSPLGYCMPKGVLFSVIEKTF